MLCPKCGADTEVRDSRPYKNYVRRRRHCKSCKHRHSTIELASDLSFGKIQTLLKETKAALNNQNASIDKAARRIRHVESELVKLNDKIADAENAP
ncbi:hypothetical protein [Hyphomicrobium sp.]|uniref:NrdR family transcriptional regulator n=1 Tax=Hyphomicrobium sp. TaxID=82 RepID=UPI001D472B7D|nr:hypothetical protein [Hyphomicrobium sp.]MBY0560145.1 hypothetical protein [Hyphomicrobium sp.]